MANRRTVPSLPSQDLNRKLRRRVQQDRSFLYPKETESLEKRGVRTLFKDVQRLSDSKSQVRPVIIAAIAGSCCRAFAEQLCSMSSTSRGFKAHGRLPNSGSKLPCQVDVGLVALELSDMTPCHSKEIDGNRIFKCPMLGGTDGLSN